MKHKRPGRTKAVRNRTKSYESAHATAYESYDRSLERRTSYGLGGSFGRGAAPTGYLHRLEAANLGGSFAPGTVTQLNISHEPACPMLHGAGVCRCHPDISFSRNGTVYVVDVFGTVKQEALLV